jgi:septum formation inhibitor MinC
MLGVENPIDSAAVTADADSPEPIVILRGTARGLELVLDASAPVDDLVAALEARLAQSPSFFAGNDATVRLLRQALPAGALGRLESVVERFALRLAEVKLDRGGSPALAAGSGPLPAAHEPPAPPPVAIEPAPVGAAEVVRELSRAPTASIAVPAEPDAAADADPSPEEDFDLASLSDPSVARFVLGPVRSGVILEAPGHLVIAGDVNPGAEVRAGRSIAVLGALRGVAHAGIVDKGWILAIRLDPQQLRIGTLLARAGEPAAARGAEIAFVADGQIVAQAFTGKFPGGIAAKR